MKLGEKLKQTLDELEKAKIHGIEAQNSADLAKIRRERNDLERWLESVREHMVDQINESRVPLKKIEDYDQQRWIKSAIEGKAKHQDLWNNFRQFWSKEGLTPVAHDAHDGVGISSWINLGLDILPARPRGNDN